MNEYVSFFFCGPCIMHVFAKKLQFFSTFLRYRLSLSASEIGGKIPKLFCW